jgi:hypothetical protein
MATLNSPGVQVSVIDESFYTPSAPGTVPMLFVATKEDKTNPSGSTALGTTAANAGKVWLITSQRDLTDTFGTPLFYTDSSGNPLHGNELNEYGLQAAYSALGVSSRAYVVRADIDLAALTPTSTEPLGDPVSGTYWVDTASSVFGIKEWNATTEKFTVKTPIVLDDSSSSGQFSGSNPSDSIGQIGDYCMIVTNANAAKLFYKKADNTWTLVQYGFDSGKALQISPHYSYPTGFNGSTATGSVWVTTTVPANGANWSVKLYNGSSQSWTTVTAPIYNSVVEANYSLDSTRLGKNVATGSLFVEYNYNHSDDANSIPPVANFKLWRKNSTGPTTIVSEVNSASINTATTYTFKIRETTSATTWGNMYTVSMSSPTATKLGSLIPAALSSQGLTHVSATWDDTTDVLTMTHSGGGAFELYDGNGTPLGDFFEAYDVATATGTVNLYTAPANDYQSGSTPFTFLATTWKLLAFEATPTAPYTVPADGTLWYDSVVDEVDIMYHNGTTWIGYKTAFGSTSPLGPIISATEPDKNTGQSDGTPLVNGDIWIDTSDIDMYGRNIYVYDTTDGWVKQDVTDQSTPDGWLFADARWATGGADPVANKITDLLNSGYLDPDAPDPALYPRGMRLWNTRRSGFNVKKYVSGYINVNSTNPRMSGASQAQYFPDRWVSQNAVAADGGPQFGRLGQRAQVIEAFKSLIDTNQSIRDNDTLGFNLMATPGYPEVIQNMIGLNTDRGITAFVVGDTPFRLEPTGTALNAWGLNTAGALDNGDEGATSYDEYMAMYYPSGYTTDNTGNKIVVPPSHMMLRTIINSDAKSYPWFAPAGTRRGGVDNASSVGYITAEGEFKTTALPQGLRDVLDDVKINPIATLTGVGVLAYGQRTRARNASALDRINVARLVCYLRKQLDVLARPFLFEPNDAQTRREIKAAAESLMLELVGQRALYDYVVVCDETNNTPSRIDRNELYVDIAIEPVKAVEFIYIPLRLKNTGDIAAGL